MHVSRSLPRLALSPLLAALLPLILASCAVTDPAEGGAATASSSTGARSKVGGRALNHARRATVEETTRENFFAWLFAPQDSAGNDRKKKAVVAEPAGPVIPPTKVHHAVLAKSNKSNTRLVVDIARQKAFLLVNGQVAVECPISTARPGKSTPRGNFRVTERVRSGKISTIYGVSMPYWMRLSGSVYGVHAGYLPGYPASAGCVRMPRDAAELIFDNTKNGTPVAIYSSWSGA